MKRLILFIALGIFLFSADISHPESVAEPVHSVVKEVLSYFPPVKGVVEDVKGNDATVLIESDTPLKKGTRLSVFREGDPFYHPVTGERLGKTESSVGRLKVIEKQDGSYRCSIINGDIMKGDRVRITSSRVKIVFFQERNADWALSEEFYTLLKDTNRFEIFDAYTKEYEPQRFSEIAKRFNAENILMLSTPLRNGTRFLNVRLYEINEAEPVDEIEVPIKRTGLSGDKKAIISIAPFETEAWGSYAIEKGELIALGDTDGDGRREIIVSDGKDISIYSGNDEPREIWHIKGYSNERHLSIGAIDLNNNGRAEIFVTSISGMEETITVDEGRFRSVRTGDVSSFVIEYDPVEGYKRIVEGIPYFTRVANGRLFMQGFNADEVFAGPVYEGVWRDGRYVVDKPLSLPDGIDIYNFTFIDWKNNGDVYLVSFDEKGYLHLYKDGNLIWRSKDSYGRPYHFFEIPRSSVVNPVKRWGIRDKVIPVRTEKGQEIIVIKRTPLLSAAPGLGYSGVDVYALWWDGKRMEERLIMNDLPGTITDYSLEGSDLFLIARGGIFSFLKNTLKGDFSRDGRLYYYRFIER